VIFLCSAFSARHIFRTPGRCHSTRDYPHWNPGPLHRQRQPEWLQEYGARRTRSWKEREN